MTGAVSAIEKLKKGLSKHPQVRAVLQRVNEAKDPNEYDNEGEMAKTQLRGIVKNANHMIEMFKDEENLPEWVQNKITKAADYLDSAHDYLMNSEDGVEESTDAYGKTIEKQRDDLKKKQMRASDKAKLGAIAQMMDREKERQKREREQQAK
jgi:hypothetical protein